MPNKNIIEYDATQEVCPVPLIKMRLMLKKLVSKGCLKFTIADSGSKKDIPKYLNNKEYDFVIREINLTVIEITILGVNR